MFSPGWEAERRSLPTATALSPPAANITWPSKSPFYTQKAAGQALLWHLHGCGDALSIALGAGGLGSGAVQGAPVLRGWYPRAVAMRPAPGRTSW